MYSIGKLAAEYELSRSTLLYYDSINLLKPSLRTETRYRLYSEEDKRKLGQICTYRQMGIPIIEIKKLLNSPESASVNILEEHLIRLSEQIRSLRKQQFTILSLLKDNQILSKAGLIKKDDWVALLRSTGLDDDGMDRWHHEFEKISPQAHHEFLASLGIDESDIIEIRRYAANFSTDQKVK